VGETELDALDQLAARVFDGHVVRKDLAPLPGPLSHPEYLAAFHPGVLLHIPIAAREQSKELSDDLALRTSILHYADAREALLKVLAGSSGGPSWSRSAFSARHGRIATET
jgi:hypothetical protein